MVANGQSAGQKLEACAMARYNSPDYALLRLISGSLAAFPPSTFA
jgi:hypothetical protein